jgi:uncharacterized membrane protein HdeD (DUF308 family)
MAIDPQLNPQLTAEIKAATAWVVFLSIGLMGLGVAAIAMPSLAITFFTSIIGWLVLVSGIVQMVQALKARSVKGIGLSLVVGVLYTLAGLYMVINPVKSAAVFALALGMLFIAEGLFTILMAFVYRVGGALSWLVALNLLLNGVSLLGAALTARRELA